MNRIKFETVEAYHAAFEGDILIRLDTVRDLLQQTLPEAALIIAYGIPTFSYQKNRIHYAGYSNHIGIYPSPRVIDIFAGQLSGYTTSKGAVQFPHSLPLPLNLIREMALTAFDKTTVS